MEDKDFECYIRFEHYEHIDSYKEFQLHLQTNALYFDSIFFSHIKQLFTSW